MCLAVVCVEGVFSQIRSHIMVMAWIADLCFKPTEVHKAEASLYDQWLPDWLNHLISGSHSSTIPMEARQRQTPLNKAA